MMPGGTEQMVFRKFSTQLRYQAPEQGSELLGLLLIGSTGQHMASQSGLP